MKTKTPRAKRIIKYIKNKRRNPTLMADVLGAIARATPEEIAILQETFAEDYEKFRHRKRVFRANEEE